MLDVVNPTQALDRLLFGAFLGTSLFLGTLKPNIHTGFDAQYDFHCHAHCQVVVGDQWSAAVASSQTHSAARYADIRQVAGRSNRPSRRSAYSDSVSQPRCTGSR